MKPGDLVGRRRMLTFLRSIDRRHIEVQCACGSPPKVVLRENVRAGRTSSCGCRASKGPTPIHGLSKTSEYASWLGRKRCPGWLDPRAFVRDLGPRPNGWMLEVVGEKLRCGTCWACRRWRRERNARWAPAARVLGGGSKRGARRFLVDCRKLTVSEAAKALGLHPNAVYYRAARGIPLVRKSS